MKTDQQNLLSSITECNKHFERLLSAYKLLFPIIPMNFNKYESLSEEEIRVLDQFLFRFTKIQDTMGQKVFPYFLLSLEEEIEQASFVDILTRVEKLISKEITRDWLNLRKLRNAAAHEYIDDPEKNANALNTFVDQTKILLDIYLAVKNEVLKRIPALSSEVAKLKDPVLP